MASNRKSDSWKQFVKYLLLAQTASDGGKGFISSKANSASKAIRAGYSLKDNYIRQAISFAKRLEGRVVMGVETSEVCFFDHFKEMSIVYFNIKDYGQVSFHSFKRAGHWKLPADTIGWNGVRGGSMATCRKLARKLNLPFYNHKVED